MRGNLCEGLEEGIEYSEVFSQEENPIEKFEL